VEDPTNPIRKSGKIGAVTFFVGIVSGVVLAKTWRPLTKKGIKAGIRAGRKIREVSQQAMEDVGDLTAEATEELIQEETIQEEQEIQ
jgi:hypothetical protein